MWINQVNQEQHLTMVRGLRPYALWQTIGQPLSMRMPLPVIPTMAERAPASFALTEFVPQGQSDVLCLEAAGELDVHAYSLLVESARARYDQGWRALVIDLSRTTTIELSGFLALLNIARLYSGQAMLDPDAGWAAMREPVGAMTPALGYYVKLVSPSPQVNAAPARVPFCAWLERYADVESALAAFVQQEQPFGGSFYMGAPAERPSRMLRS